MATKCSGKTPTGRACRRVVEPDAEVCQYHLKLATAKPVFEAKTEEEEDMEFSMAIEDAPWWSGYERWLEQKIRNVIEKEKEWAVRQDNM